ncbi:MAG TPA: extracellular solute-binding protein [Firmicutes bacterium]|nr:extracellular solute-binding protein [Bacillota bacterium]
MSTSFGNVRRMAPMRAGARTMTALVLVTLFLLALPYVQAAEPIVIRMYSGFEASETIIDDYLRLYEKLHPGVKIEDLGSEWDVNKLTTLFVAGNAPDIIQHSTGYVQQLYREGFLAPVPAQLASRISEKFYPVLVRSVSVGGTLAGVPTENMVTGLWFNKTVLDEAGIASLPPTLADLERTGAKLARFDPDGRLDRPALVEHGEWWSFNHFGWATFKALGGEIMDEKGKLALDGQPFRDLLAMVPRWIGPKGFMAQGWNQLERFFKGDIALGFGYLWWAGIIRTSYKGDYLKNFGVGLYPKGPGGYGALHYAHAYGVNKNSKHLDEVWRLLEWLALEPVEGVTPLGHALSTKSLPVNRDDFQSRYYDTYRPWSAGFIANLQYAWTDSQFEVYDAVDFATAMWKVRDGTASPAQAIAEAVQKVQNKLSELQRAKKSP